MGFPELTNETIDNTLGFHPADTDERRHMHELARRATIAYAKVMNGLLPGSREKSLWFTHVQEGLMQANAALAINRGPRSGADLGEIEVMVESLEEGAAGL